MLLAHRVVEPRAASDRPPLLVLLHGIGADEADLLPLAQFFDPRFTVVSARAPHEAEPMGYRWYAIDWAVMPPRGDRGEIVASRDLLARFVEEATAAYGTDPSSVFLFGFSQGAVMSLAIILARPDLVRGVVAHSGQLARLPGPDPDPEALSRAEVLLLHGAQDPVIPASQGHKAYEVLEPLLGARVAYRAFDGLGHGISEDSIAEAARWLTARLDDLAKSETAASGSRSPGIS
jgi:phospholipase/carboxylesterase